MKKFILILGFMMLSTFAFANDGVIKTFTQNIPSNSILTTNNTFGTVCIDGYKFAFMKAYGANGVALVQIFDKGSRVDNPQPIKCK